MNTKGIVGKRIVKVIQELTPTREHGHKQSKWDVHGLMLEDGTMLVPMVHETDFADYVVDVHVVKGKVKKAGRVC